MDELFRIRKAKTLLMMRKPFYGPLCARLRVSIDDGPFFSTDGVYLYVPKKHRFNDDELIFIVAHETLHCALGHLHRMGKRNRLKWNVAADLAINYILAHDGFRVPEKLLYDEKYANMSVEQIYDKLPNSAGKSFEFGDLREAGEKGSSLTPEQADENKHLWKEMLSHSLNKNRGSIPAGIRKYIEGLLYTPTPWQTILFRHLQNSKGQQDFKSYPFNRAHIYRDIYLPSMCGDSIELCVAIDTSGSIDENQLKWALSEIRTICGTFGEYKLHLFMCDAKVSEYIEIASESDIPQFIVGGGGTSFVPVFNEIEKLELSNIPLVYITDLDGEFPKEKREDVYWLMFGSSHYSKKEAPFGELIIMDDYKK